MQNATNIVFKLCRSGDAMRLAAQTAHKALVFLIGNEDMRRLFDDWPQRMQLAVCLKEDGDCRLLAHREEEGEAFLPRLLKTLRLPSKEICFFPEIKGYPTRKVLYSEEKQLFALVNASPEIVEEAADYSINYSFALDEGLDPAKFMHDSAVNEPALAKKSVQKKRATSEKSKAASGRIVQKTAQQVTPKPHDQPEAVPENVTAKPSVALPRFMQKTSSGEPGPAFQSLEQIKATNPLPKSCVVHRERDGWIGIDLPDCIGGMVTVSNPGRIFVRDDRRMIAIQSDQIKRDGGPLPGHISLGVKFLPEGLREIFESSAGEADLSFDNGFLFITLRAPAKLSAPKVDVTSPLRRLGAYWRMLASAAAVGVILAVGLQFVSGPRTLSDAETNIDWGQFQSGALDDAALDAELNRALSRLEG